MYGLEDFCADVGGGDLGFVCFHSGFADCDDELVDVFDPVGFLLWAGHAVEVGGLEFAGLGVFYDFFDLCWVVWGGFVEYCGCGFFGCFVAGDGSVFVEVFLLCWLPVFGEVAGWDGVVYVSYFFEYFFEGEEGGGW